MNTKRLISLMLVLACGSAVAIVDFNLGAGYSSSTGVLFPTCLEIGDTWEKHLRLDNPKGHLTFSQITSRDELHKSLSVSGKINFKNTVFTASGEGSYLDSMKKSSTATTIVYKIEVNNKATLVFDRYKDPIEGILGIKRDDYKYAPASFLATCGDMFIGSAMATGSFVVGIQIDFEDRKQRENFEADVKAEMKKPGMELGVAAALTMAENSQTGAGKITITADQLGGDPLKLPNLMHKDKNGNFAVASCGGGSGTHCIDIVTSILEYANGLADQFYVNGVLDKSKYYYTSPEPMLYSSKFGKAENPDITESRRILNDMHAAHSKFASERSLVAEYMARVGSYPPDNVPILVKDLTAYDTTLRDSMYIYSNNEDLQKCRETLKLDDCKAAEVSVNLEKENLKNKHKHDFDLTSVRGERALEIIQTNNFTLSLLTLKDTMTKPYQFQQMFCELSPVLLPGRGLTSAVQCPKS